ncbi:MAG: hypothetical protein AB7O60_03345 [Variibacter sp.]
MATTIKQTESLPESYPVLSPAVSDAVWQRIESYTAHRFTSRQVVWIVEGCGEWMPPLAPATVTKVEIWSSADVWEDVTANASPCGGYWLPATGPYRFTATVGADAELPVIVATAAQRLSTYMAAKPGKPGATSESVSAGSISVSHRRSESWMAAAMQNSGAADLLRGYRRV